MNKTNMNDTDVYDIPMTELIPQRSPFVMVDHLCHFDAEVTVTDFTIKPECLMVENGFLSAAGIAENMAQTCAARIGYVNYINRRNIKIGFIGAIRNLLILKEPAVGEMLKTEMKVKEEFFKMTLADITVYCGNEIIATAEMKIAVGDKEVTD